ncbi:MAG: glycosyltransferase family 4 protein, partial [candidate division Zixibacteria bacterium]|nr:glycosyltransferase family 4 protein [candidate division Zixibacteria bacterium]
MTKIQKNEPIDSKTESALTKVLIDTTSLATPHRFRGIGRYVWGLLGGFEKLQKEELAIEMVCLTQIRGIRNNDHFPFPYRTIRNRRPSYPSIRLQWLWNSFLLAKDVTKTESFLFHSTDYNGIPISKKFKTVATLYDLIPLVFFETYLKDKPLDIRLGYKSMLKRYQEAFHIISISEATKKDAIQLLGISEDRITVVPLAFDKKLFYPLEDSNTTGKIKIKYNLPERYFLYSGSLESHKNIERALKAYKSLSNLPERFVFIGVHSRGQRESFLNQIRDLGLTERVKHLGYVEDDDLSALFCGATAFVFPSLKEGFGLPALEAMACGCPVISSNLSAMPEVVGDAGILIDPYDEKALGES